MHGLQFGDSICANADGKYLTWALDVADNASSGIVHELDSDLSNTTTGTYIPSVLPLLPPHIYLADSKHTGTAQNSRNLDKLDGNL